MYALIKLVLHFVFPNPQQLVKTNMYKIIVLSCIWGQAEGQQGADEKLTLLEGIHDWWVCVGAGINDIKFPGLVGFLGPKHGRGYPYFGAFK